MTGAKAKSRRESAGEEVNLAVTIREAHAAVGAVADSAVEIALEILHHKAVMPVTTIAIAIEAAATRRVEEFFAHRTCRTIIVGGLGIFQIGAPMMNRVRWGAMRMSRPRVFGQGRTGEQGHQTCTGNRDMETEIHGPPSFMRRTPATGLLYQYDTIALRQKRGKRGLDLWLIIWRPAHGKLSPLDRP
jgi:hypothetical protein